MAPLYNLRQEKFAQLVAVGDKPMADSYIEAGYLTKDYGMAGRNASNLRHKPHVAARIDELRERAAKKLGLKIENIIEMLLEDRKRAHVLDQPSAAIRAAELLGKYLGMFVDKKEIKTGTLEEIDLTTLEHFRQRLVSAATRNALEGDREGAEGKEDRDLLPGDGSATERALSEASAILRGGGES